MVHFVFLTCLLSAVLGLSVCQQSQCAVGLNHCVQSLQEILNNDLAHEGDLSVLCMKWTESVSCIDNHVRECFTAADAMVFNNYMAETREFLQDICKQVPSKEVVPESSFDHETTSLLADSITAISESSLTNETQTDISTSSAFVDVQQLSAAPRNENIYHSLNAGGIFGIIMCVLVIIIITGAVWYYFRRRKGIRPKLLVDETL